jgi:hypothetical protein
VIPGASECEDRLSAAALITYTVSRASRVIAVLLCHMLPLPLVFEVNGVTTEIKPNFQDIHKNCTTIKKRRNFDNLRNFFKSSNQTKIFLS